MELHYRADGEICGVRPAEGCTYHQRGRRKYVANESAGLQPAREGASEPARPLPESVEVALAKRDLRTVLWHFLEGLVRGADDGKKAGPAAAIGRLIISMGDEDGDREAMLAETALIGSVLHGAPPRDEAQWELARKLFDEHTLAQLEDWMPVEGWYSTIGGHQVRKDLPDKA